jgi:predicted anti-sigma-YlaC factor YlaD
MSHEHCWQETAVARAVRTGEWNESLQAHLRECASCRAVQETARWMQALAPAAGEQAQSQNDLPDPRVLWLRAQLSQRQATAERVHVILQWVEVACITAACAALAIWLAWSWNGSGGEVADGFGWALYDAWPALWANLYAYAPVNSPILFSLALAAISLVTAAVAYPLLSRE